MSTQPVSADRIADELAAAMPVFDEREQHIALSLLRLLAEGQPVSAERLAQSGGLATAEARELLERWPLVQLDERARVVGFSGLALGDMPHQLHVDGRELSTWCAWDTLFLPELLGSPARIESPCVTTGRTVCLEVVPGEGVRNLSPETAVLSFLRPDRCFGSDTIKSFCHFVHFFASREAAEEWTATHQGTFVLSVDEGFEIGRVTNHAVFGAALEPNTDDAARAG